ncbi:glycerol-3-phosphate dehydrogenase [Litoreibacter janthinus]|uniref:Glycerol-3-phosphate dehydrogenase n=1 Tax=Litoreibacter janthinus TaxID=670154 RepID=A0A1I6G6U9_9RHOB|nr:glycerol-3-phosphate dehydrogenase [Litoreibacter janthinus]SFR37926.1 homodimeric glycerol 3-phosphate dehydrogenase (quinone) [Litoreibacter janthinus]
MAQDDIVDLFIIGGGINGVGIARDAAGRGISVSLAEMNDLGWATSSASTKLFHGGLRYLEFFEIGLVRKALIERETLLKAMPHISWPMRFVLPYHKDMRFESETPTSKLLSVVMPWMKGRRPAWLIRLGLFLYDNLGGREILPGTRSVDLTKDEVGEGIEDRFTFAYEYSDCWIEDARLVILNARDAQARGAEIHVRTKVTTAERTGNHWTIHLLDVETGSTSVRRAKMLVNAGGPWVEDVIRNVARINSTEGVRLVRGSHIVTKRLFTHDKAYFFQGEDGRIIFAIPYETDFTLIGTTDAEHSDPSVRPVCTDAERDYLIAFANGYFKYDISVEDVVWTYSGVRPLYDDGAKSATAATRDYVLSLDDNGAPLLNVFGGKITTYRKLAENALEKIGPLLGNEQGKWTSGVPMPGGDFSVDDVQGVIDGLIVDYPFLDDAWAKRLVRAYGTDAHVVLGDAAAPSDLGRHFGANLTEREVRWLMTSEYARRAEDVVWRRSKLGLRMSEAQISLLDEWMQQERGTRGEDE